MIINKLYSRGVSIFKALRSFAHDLYDSLYSFCRHVFRATCCTCLDLLSVALSSLHSNELRVSRLCTLLHNVTSRDKIACHLSVRTRPDVQDEPIERRMELEQ